jgi:hypothetical protein
MKAFSLLFTEGRKSKPKSDQKLEQSPKQKQRKTRKNDTYQLIFLFAFCLLTLPLKPLLAGPFSLKIVGGFFFPSDQAFREIYGSGDTSGIEVTLELNKKLDFWARATYFFKRGHLTLTGEPTQVEIIPIGYGIKYKFSLKKLKNIIFYAGAGLDYFVFSEVNVLAEINTGNMGFSGRGGLVFQFFKGMLAELYLNYSRCLIHPAEYEVNIGGWQIIFGLGYHF